jgi:hypothetical protein
MAKKLNDNNGQSGTDEDDTNSVKESTPLLGGSPANYASVDDYLDGESLVAESYFAGSVSDGGASAAASAAASILIQEESPRHPKRRRRTKKGPHLILVGVSAMAAGLCSLAANMTIKSAGGGQPPPEQRIWAQSFLQLVAMAAVLLWHRVHPLKSLGGVHRRRRSVFLCLIGGLSLVANAVSTRCLPPSNLLFLMFAPVPLLTVLFYAARRRDRGALIRVALALCTGGGVLLLAHPTFVVRHLDDDASPTASTTSFTTTSCSFGDGDAAAKSGAGAEAAAVAYLYDLLNLIVTPFLAAALAAVMRWCTTMNQTAMTEPTGHKPRFHPAVLVFWLAVGGQVLSLLGILYNFDRIGGGGGDDTLFRSGGGGGQTDVVVRYLGWTAETWGVVALAALFDTAAHLLLAAGLRWMEPDKLMLVRSSLILILFLVEVYLSTVQRAPKKNRPR